MSVEANKEIVRRFYEAIGRKDFSTVEQLCHPEFVFYPQIDTPHYGAKGFIDAEKKNFDAFDGFTMPIHSIFGDGDEVAVYLVFEGRQSGPCLGIPPRGNRLRFSLMMRLKIEDGKIIEKRAHYDRADVISQLKAIS